jgi:hypothetical protein
MVATDAFADRTAPAPAARAARWKKALSAVRKRLISLLHLAVPLTMLALALGLRVGVPSLGAINSPYSTYFSESSRKST